MAAKAPYASTAKSLGFQKNNPSAPPGFQAVLAKRPVAKAPYRPPIPCTATTSRAVAISIKAVSPLFI
ncbi:MAG: hypothetical protein ABFR35_03135 [Thermodesulfobacteriota bacterium]